MSNTSFLNYRISGTGNPIVFLHGFMEDLHMWDKLVENIPCRAICIDLNGHGKSAFTPHEPPSIRFMAMQVAEILSHENILNAIIVGHSMGGYVALELIEMIPDLEHVVLFHSHPWEDSIEKKRDRDRVVEVINSKVNVFIREAIPHLFYDKEQMHEPIERYIKTAENIRDKNAISWSAQAMKNRQDKSSIFQKRPTFLSVILGEKDALISAEKLMGYCDDFHISYIKINNVGHMSHEESFIEACEALRTILVK